MQKRERLERQAPRPGETSLQRSIRENKILFAAADRYLDRALEGPMHLKDPGAANIVEDAILFGAGERYELFAWCVMSNHVHVLLTPNRREAEEGGLDARQAGKPDLQMRQAGKPDLRIWDLPNVMKGIKGYTAYRINKMRGTRGQAFWQDESYDHWRVTKRK